MSKNKSEDEPIDLEAFRRALKKMRAGVALNEAEVAIIESYSVAAAKIGIHVQKGIL